MSVSVINTNNDYISEYFIGKTNQAYNFLSNCMYVDTNNDNKSWEIKYDDLEELVREYLYKNDEWTVKKAIDCQLIDDKYDTDELISELRTILEESYGNDYIEFEVRDDN